MRAAIVATCDRLESFLTGGILRVSKAASRNHRAYPDLQFNRLAIQIDRFYFKVDSDSADKVFREGVILKMRSSHSSNGGTYRVSQQKTALTHSAVTNE